MGTLDGKVAFISGAARGQGRSHAIRLAQEGADIIAFDICRDVAIATYPMGTREELEETAELVRAAGTRAIAVQADVRDLDALTELAATAVDSFGRIDIVLANAAVNTYAPTWEMTEEQWSDVIDTNLTGVFNTIKATLPALISGGRGGAIVATSSGAVFRGYTETAAYTSAKYGIVGFIRSLALEVAQYGIRVNALAPTGVNTPMVVDDPTVPRRARRDLENAVLADAIPRMTSMNAIPIPWIESIDVSEAMLWLVSDDSRYITGFVFPVDAGLSIK